jgi:hypothetical protein
MTLYHFKVYALDTRMSFLPQSTDRIELENSIKDHIIASGEIIGLCKA